MISFQSKTYLLFAWIVFLCIWALICPLVWSHLFLVSDLDRSPTESRSYKLDAGGHFKVVHINRLYFGEKIGKPLVVSSHITHHRVVTGFLTSVTLSADVLMLLIPMLIFMLMLTRAVEPGFKKSYKKSDAQGASRRFYPTFA